MSRRYDTFGKKRERLPIRSRFQESTFHTVHDVLQMWFSDFVVDPTSFTLTGEEPTPLHQSEMFRSDIAGHIAIFSQFANRVATMEQQLHHSQPHRMRQRFQAFRSLSKRRRITRRLSFRFCFRGQFVSPYTNISTPSDMSI
jgi:hypothetical protein